MASFLGPFTIATSIKTETALEHSFSASINGSQKWLSSLPYEKSAGNHAHGSANLKMSDQAIAQQKLLLALQHWSLTVLHRHMQAWRRYACGGGRARERPRATIASATSASATSASVNAASEWLSSLLLAPAPDPPPLPPLRRHPGLVVHARLPRLLRAHPGRRHADD